MASEQVGFRHSQHDRQTKHSQPEEFTKGLQSRMTVPAVLGGVVAQLHAPGRPGGAMGCRPFSSSSGRSIDAAEAEKFGAQAAEWWRADGPFAMLHSMNPIRCTFIRQSLCSHFRLDPDSPEPLKGLKILDVGCGGGLLSESLARMGADVTGVDATERNIRIAEAHAASDPLMQERIAYRAEAVEDLAEAGEEFDAVMCLEVIEHVAGPGEFCDVLARLTKNGGALVMSTMNRTPLSYAVAILGAEYITHVVPQGTHDWERFVCPEELTVMLRDAGLQPTTAAGMTYNPLTNVWHLGDDLNVNYIATYVKELQEKPAECADGGLSGVMGSSPGNSAMAPAGGSGPKA